MSPDEMAFVSVTPDHIDVALHAAFALHAGESALRLLLLLVIRISSLIFFFFFIIFFLLFFFLLYFNIYLLNEEEEREKPDEKTLVARVGFDHVASALSITPRRHPRYSTSYE